MNPLSRSLTIQSPFMSSSPFNDKRPDESRMASLIGHDFSLVSVFPTTADTTLSCPLAAGPRACPFGGACHICPSQAQTKLVVGRSDDSFEQEADQIADRVMRMSAPPVREPVPSGGRAMNIQHRQAHPGCGGDKIDMLQTESLPGAVPQRLDAYSGVQSLSGAGRPLDVSTRAFMEPRFGRDFSRVQVHSDIQADKSARSMDAHAYTIERDIFFGAGQYAPATSQGRRLLAHELTHVVQQGDSGPLDIGTALPTEAQPSSPLQNSLSISRLQSGLVVQRECKDLPDEYLPFSSIGDDYNDLANLDRAKKDAKSYELFGDDVSFEQKGTVVNGEEGCPDGMKYARTEDSIKESKKVNGDTREIFMYLCKDCTTDKLAFKVVIPIPESGNDAPPDVAATVNCTKLPTLDDVKNWAKAAWDQLPAEETKWGLCPNAAEYFAAEAEGCSSIKDCRGHVITIGQYDGGWYIFDPTIDQFTNNPGLPGGVSSQKQKAEEARANATEQFIVDLHCEPGLALFSSPEDLNAALDKYHDLEICVNPWTDADLKDPSHDN